MSVEFPTTADDPEPEAAGLAASSDHVVGEASDAGPAAPADPDSGSRLPAPGPSAPEQAARRAADLRLARLHLRLGLFLLARAELEAANADQLLAGGSLLDLAEVRWRTGDLAGAGQAAEASLAAGPEALLAIVVAAEAAFADGRPSDASDLAARALQLAGPDPDDALGLVFGGMPRSGIWPGDPLDIPTPDGSPAGRGARRAASSGRLSSLPRTRLQTPRPAHPTLRPVRSAASGERPDADPLAELAAAEADLEAGDTDAAVIRLGVVLRTAPALAPPVLELLQGTPGPLAALIRGDAYRLVGREAEAGQAFAEATQSIATGVTDATADLPNDAILEDPQ